MIDYTFIPSLKLVVADFDKLGVDIRSFKEPLRRSIQQVAAPSIQQNFAEGGRPSWEPLNEETVAIKERKGQTSAPLIATGLLEQVAGQLNAWSIDGVAGTATFQLGGRASYGHFDIEGTKFMPVRDFAVLQDSDVDSMELVFETWLGERLLAAGFR